MSSAIPSNSYIASCSRHVSRIKTWMAGSSPAMTSISQRKPRPVGETGRGLGVRSLSLLAMTNSTSKTARRGWARTRRLGERRPLVSTECEPRRDVHQKPLQGDLEAGRGYSRGAQARQKRLGDACNEALEAHNVENACEVVTERHQAPFAANLVEAAHQEVAIAGAAFESAEGMLHDGGAAGPSLVRRPPSLALDVRE